MISESPKRVREANEPVTSYALSKQQMEGAS